MPGLYLDTAGWFAAMSPPEEGHASARRAYEVAAESGTELVTTPFVIAEMHTLVLRWRGQLAGRRFLEVAFDPLAHRVVAPDTETIRAAIERWTAFDKQRFSMCDMVSFEVMTQERLSRALTFDRHFQRAGFEILSARSRG